jgi:IS30 family transposase
MKPYKHLTLWERYHIRSAIQFKHKPAKIARSLDRDSTTIRREIQRGGGYHAYDPEKAHFHYEEKRGQERTPYRFKGTLKHYALQLLTQTGLEPAGIGPRLQLEHGEPMNVSHMTVYRHIYRDAQAGGNLYSYLRTARKKPNPRKKGKRPAKSLKTGVLLTNALPLLTR